MSFIMDDDRAGRVRERIADAERQLAAIPGNPRQDAELLMAAALGVSIGDLHLRHLDELAPAVFADHLRRRLAREPIPYIAGRAGFWTIDLQVGPGVLIPRADSETLIEAAIAAFGSCMPATILDLGTGPGTLLLAALATWPSARGVGIDGSKEALEYARRNAAALGLADRSTFQPGNWAADLSAPFDLILCNPPYIADEAELPPDVAIWEPHAALFAGPDGLDAYRVLAPQIARLLAPGGVACIELGAGQLADVTAIFAPHRFTRSSRADLRGVERCLILRR